MADASDAVFDKIMESVGDSGPFQKRFNYVFNVGAVICASMAFMNVILAMNVPDHWCRVPGRENLNSSFDLETWKNLTLPKEIDNRGVETFSSCRMYNFSSITELTEPNRNLTELEIECTHGYEYDHRWYEKTAVSQEDWVCNHDMYATNTFAFHRLGELVGTMIFGQLGDILGRKPIFYISTLTIILGRLASVMVTQYYVIFSIVSVVNMLTSISIFQAPLIIAMEVSKGEDRAHIAMNQYLGWTVGMCIMPMVFWLVRDWVWFLLITTLPCGIFLFFPKYMLESPRWLANKGHFKRCAETLAQIAKINGKNVEYTEKSLKELMKNNKIESVYGMASLFTHWRLAKNTALIVVCWSVASLAYFTLILNASKMAGNPFLNFMWQSAVEMPAFMIGRVLGDKMGRRLTISLSFLVAGLACVPIFLTVSQPEYDIVTIVFAIAIKFSTSITFYVVNLHAMETYPTCLRQTGLSIGSIVANFLGVLGPYIVYLGTNYDVRYPYLILFVLLLVGAAAGLCLPETLHQNLPESLEQAQRFGKDQKFWSWPRPQPPKEIAAELEKLNKPEH